jgi:hypothetical protein
MIGASDLDIDCLLDYILIVPQALQSCTTLLIETVNTAAMINQSQAPAVNA